MGTARGPRRPARTRADETDELGTGIRARRKALGLTLVELAQRTDLSQPFLSQIERGLAQPSMRSLNVIARALNTSGPALLAGASSAAGGGASVAEKRIVRNDEGAGTPVDATSGLARSLAPGANGVTVTEFVGGMPVMPNYYWRHSGREILYVVKGQVELQLEAGSIQLLDASQSVSYEGSTPHRWRMVGGEPGVVLLIAYEE